MDPSIPPELLVKDDYEAFLTCTDTPCDYTTLKLYIDEVDTTANTIKIKFPGAPSGNYRILLNHQGQAVDTTLLDVVTEGLINSVSAN